MSDPQAEPHAGDWRCDCCGEDRSPNFEAICDNPDLHTLELHGYYGSVFPQDLDSLSMSVCGGCLRKWVESFAIPPTTTCWSPALTADGREYREKAAPFNPALSGLSGPAGFSLDDGE